MANLRKLFADRPSNDPAFIRDTFVNREKELLVGTKFLQSEPFDGGLYAIYGFSRVGKSHLAMRIAQEMVAQEHCLYFYCNTQLQGSAFNVLHELFCEIQKAIAQVSACAGKEDDLAFLQSYIKLMEGLIAGMISEIQEGTLQELSENISAGFKAKIPYIGIGVSLGGNKQTKGQSNRAITYTKPDLKGLQAIITFLLDALADVSAKKILILLDDLDLLDDDEELDRLNAELKIIAKLPAVAFFLTIRTRYLNQNPHNFEELTNVAPMQVAALKAIYQKRVEIFNDNEDPFEAEVLDTLAQGFRGLIGPFLKECERLFKDHLVQIEAKRPVSKSHLNTYLTKELQKLYEDRDTAPFINEIATAVKNGQTQWTSDLPIPEGSGLVYRLLLPLGYKEHAYEILPIFRQTLENYGSEPAP